MDNYYVNSRISHVGRYRNKVICNITCCDKFFTERFPKATSPREKSGTFIFISLDKKQFITQ